MRTISPVLRAAPILEKSRLVLIRCLRCVIIRVRCKTYLECEGRKTDDNSSREKEGLDDDTLIEEGDQDSCKREKPLIDVIRVIVINKTYISLLTNSVGLDDGKCGQKDQVNGSFLPLDVECDQKSN